MRLFAMIRRLTRSSRAEEVDESEARRAMQANRQAAAMRAREDVERRNRAPGGGSSN